MMEPIVQSVIQTVQHSLHCMGFKIRRPTRIPLLNACHWAAHLAWAREHRDWIVEDWKQQDNKSRLATRWLDEHFSDFSVINWPPRRPNLNPVEHPWDVLEGMKGHYTAPKNLTELWAALANIWRIIPVEYFQKLVESIITFFLQINNSVALAAYLVLQLNKAK
ncbi:transposable element Tc1 transposase [Trichonephila clavipes]|nr:transposable element Tc1 transposase [Trichonephila clavipes]